MIEISLENVLIYDIEYRPGDARDASAYVVYVRSRDPSSHAMPSISEHHRVCERNVEILHDVDVDLAMIQHARARERGEHDGMRWFSSLRKEDDGNRKNQATYDEQHICLVEKTRQNKNNISEYNKNDRALS
jgi:hypothetical protein